MIYEIGPHRVRHGDVTHGIADLMRDDKVDLMYSDPPWGEGNIKYWSTMNKKMTGTENPPASLDALLGAIFGIAQAYVKQYLLIDYGIRWRDMIIQRAALAGFQKRAVIQTVYNGGKTALPLDHIVFTRDSNAPLPEGYERLIAGTTGITQVQKTIWAFAPIVSRGLDSPIFLDPCNGLGLMIGSAKNEGFVVRGNEINGERLRRAIERLKMPVKPYKPR